MVEFWISTFGGVRCCQIRVGNFVAFVVFKLGVVVIGLSEFSFVVVIFVLVGILVAFTVVAVVLGNAVRLLAVILCSFVSEV